MILDLRTWEYPTTGFLVWVSSHKKHKEILTRRIQYEYYPLDVNTIKPP
jgi:hypothetical protein